MAGAGYRAFVAGEKLTAANVNTYLMQQSVMTFTDATARDAAITSPSEGMVVFLKDSDRLFSYSTAGTAGWRPIAPYTSEVGTASATLVSGSPWSTQTGSVTFTSGRFITSQVPIVNATVVVSSSAQATVQVYSITNTGFSYRISLYAASTSTLTVHWSAFQATSTAGSGAG